MKKIAKKQHKDPSEALEEIMDTLVEHTDCREHMRIKRINEEITKHLNDSLRGFEHYSLAHRYLGIENDFEFEKCEVALAGITQCTRSAGKAAELAAALMYAAEGFKNELLGWRDEENKARTAKTKAARPDPKAGLEKLMRGNRVRIGAITGNSKVKIVAENGTATIRA